MALPNPFRRRTSNTRSCWGYTFELTPEHPSPAQMQPLKFSYDTLGEAALHRLNEISPPPQNGLPRKSNDEAQAYARMDKTAEAPEERDRSDLYALLRDHAAEDETLGALWRELTTVPEWVDWAQIARGQDVFYRYGGAALTGLAYQSLLGGMGAARVVETLARTGGFGTKVARRRLFETTQHILQCTKSVESLQCGGEGFASSIRVRLLHAAVRTRIMKLAETRPEYYNVEEWGVPINDLDSIATIGTFSATLVWLSLPRQGIFLRQQEIVDYIALWRYIGYLVGCPTKDFETPDQAKRIMEVLLYYEVQPTETSQVLANNIIRSLENQPPTYASADMLIASARWLNGNALCDELGLPRPSAYYWALMAGQCIFFMVMNYAYRAVPSWDRHKNEMLRDVFWKLIVDSKWGLEGKQTNFDFKYVPEYGILTELGNSEKAVLKEGYVERRNLKWLLLAAGVSVMGTYASYRVVSALVSVSAGLAGSLLGMVW
ncbi:hypothetical protein K490DRAFT_35442 [Saccharata proteae CBS 121410]|uniref:ER-bound oxygenase mpaB/mpaB'/Rubber oxygenase catalytic domain-containing protein n=1 Tax=Saccharata proteae CBS 121410 TaxID=1314787 RepID=A0A9P4HZM9_9PEZI|nr:hypothetical protein K490DRAFT_35442 [Saccharata proteae CBS 121410]